MGLRMVEKKTNPRLKARLPLEFCAHAVDDPAIGMAATSARPTRIYWTSNGSYQSRMAMVMP